MSAPLWWVRSKTNGRPAKGHARRSDGGVFSTREAAEEFAEGDPFALNGVVRNRFVREWDEAFVSV
jgi:hypothetical protein